MFLLIRTTDFKEKLSYLILPQGSVMGSFMCNILTNDLLLMTGKFVAIVTTPMIILVAAFY